MVAMVTLSLSIWFAHKSLKHKLEMRKVNKTRVSVYGYMNAYIHTYIYIYWYIHTYIHIVYTYVLTVHTYVHMYVRVTCIQILKLATILIMH